MTRSAGRRKSRSWARNQARDPYVRLARSSGYRSRASYKLLDMHAKAGLFKPGSRVVDLGSAPGGWSQVATELAGSGGVVVAVDLLPMEGLAGVEFIQGDIREGSVQSEVGRALGSARADLVMSDMAPNLSGVQSTDQANMVELLEMALGCAHLHLRVGGSMLVKGFEGSDWSEIKERLIEPFSRSRVLKPSASRDKSRELYLLCEGYSGTGPEVGVPDHMV